MNPLEPDASGYAAVILAGGAGRRLGGPAKPTLPVGGRTMLDRVLAAVADAAPRVVVGPASLVLPPDVRRASEHPPGGGPVAALAAGLAALAAVAAAGDPTRPDPAATATPDPAELAELGGPVPAATTAPDPGGFVPDAAASDSAGLAGLDGVGLVAVLAADLPFLMPWAVRALLDTVRESTVDGAVFVDAAGRQQTLCGLWRIGALRGRLDACPEPHGAALRHLLAGLRIAEVAAGAGGPPPWYDCDSPEDLDRARRWG